MKVEVVYKTSQLVNASVLLEINDTYIENIIHLLKNPKNNDRKNDEDFLRAYISGRLNIPANYVKSIYLFDNTNYNKKSIIAFYNNIPEVKETEEENLKLIERLSLELKEINSLDAKVFNKFYYENRLWRTEYIKKELEELIKKENK